MTLLIVSSLAIVKKPSLVEMKLTVESAAFLALPPVQDEGAADDAAAAPALTREISLFPPSLDVEAMEVEDADCVETILDGLGPVALQTEPGGGIGIRRDQPFAPRLVLNEPTFLAFEIAGRDKVTIRLEARQPLPAPWARPVTAGSAQAVSCVEAGSEAAGWSGSVPTGVERLLRLRSVRAFGPAGIARAELSPAEDYRVPQDASRFRIFGGKRDSQWSLALPHPAGPATILRVLDPATGELEPPRRLPFALSEPRSLPWRDRLVLLDPDPGGERAVQLLRSDLQILDLELARRVQLEAKSFVVDGEIRFPAGEKEPITLEAGSFVSLASDRGRPLTLRSLAFSGQRLALLVWGEPTSLRTGPTPELRAERLPSYFEWLLKHRVGGLVYGALAYVSALSLAVFKLLGWLNPKG